MLCASGVLLLPDAAYAKEYIPLWVKGDLSSQHITPQRRVVVFNRMGLTEIVLNRPVDILRKLFDGNALRSQIEEFFNRFGAGEAAAMCLMLAAKLLGGESNVISEKAAEALEDPGLVGMPQIDGTSALSNTRAQTGGFSKGQVVQEAEPSFSGAYEGLCLCSSRLLYPLWNTPIMVIRKPEGANEFKDGVVVCTYGARVMRIYESQISSLETFLRSRRNKTRGLYGYVAGLGDSGSLSCKTEPIINSGVRSNGRSLYNSQIQDTNTADQSASNKKRGVLYTSAELAAMEVGKHLKDTEEN
jgi:nuclear pore complex protein Nup155